jgi:hypothetical protein
MKPSLRITIVYGVLVAFAIALVVKAAQVQDRKSVV